jgi:hypothetical protein
MGTPKIDDYLFKKLIKQTSVYGGALHNSLAFKFVGLRGECNFTA